MSSSKMGPTTLAVALCLVVATVASAESATTSAAASSSDPSAAAVVVQTQQGEVVGMVEEVDGIRIRAFRGIPYAADTSGENRWRAPQDPEPWSEPFDASDFGPICPQDSRFYMNYVPQAIQTLDGDVNAYAPFMNNIVMSEDCLRINVYTPAAPPSGDASWPVMFRVHGGWNLAGSGNDYSPYAMVQRGVILVSFNYRMSALGSFAHPALNRGNETYKTNFGLLDVVKALDWVQENIGAFGGDAERVTPFGNSPYTTALLVTPLARGKFHSAIVDNPFFWSSLDIQLPQAAEQGRALGRALGIPPGPGSLAALRNTSYDDIVEVYFRDFGSDKVQHRPNSLVAMYVDGVSLTSSVLDAFRRGDVADVPIIMGSDQSGSMIFNSNTRGGSFLKINATTAKIVQDPEEYAAFIRESSPDEQTAQKILDTYPANNPTEVIAKSAQIKTDRFDWTQSYMLAHLLAKRGRTVYFYTHSVFGGLDMLDLAPIAFSVAATSGGRLWGQKFSITVDASLADTVVTYWSNMAKTADPNEGGEKKDGGELPEWLPLGRGRNRWMVLGPEVGMQRIPKEDVKKYELWQPFAERATKELVLP